MKGKERILFMALIATLFMLILSGCDGVSIGMKSSNWGDQWNVSFKSSTEVLSESIDVKENDDRILYITGSCESGYLQLELVQGEISKVYDLSEQTEKIEVKLNEFNEGKVKMILTNEDAKNAKFKSYWE